MGISAYFFSKKGVTITDIVEWIKSNYTDVRVDLKEEKLDRNDEFLSVTGTVCFKANESDTFRLFIYLPGFSEDAETHTIPMDNVPGESISIITASLPKYIELLVTMAKEFGGYVCERDCDEKWVYYPPEKTRTESDTLEGRLYNLVHKYNESLGEMKYASIRNSPSMTFIVDFIKSNLDEIKKL